MVWIFTATEPKLVETRKHLGQKQRTVNYFIQPVAEAGYTHKYKSVTLEPGVWHYDAIVNAIISAEYPTDKMQAIINNYLADPESDDAVEEMLEMQNDRKIAKRIAKDALAYVESQESVQNLPAVENNAPTQE